MRRKAVRMWAAWSPSSEFPLHGTVRAHRAWAISARMDFLPNASARVRARFPIIEVEIRPARKAKAKRKGKGK